MLLLFPVPIGSDETDRCIPPYNCEMLNTCRHFIVENTRTARRNLKHMGYTGAINQTEFYELNEHTTEKELSTLNAQLSTLNSQGLNIGLMSEAGVPCIADPGARVVAYAQRNGIPVVPLVGPSSLLLGLMASGFNGQNFAFRGYLPIEPRKRQRVLSDIVHGTFRNDQTQILIETPYRNNKLLAELAATMPPEALICVACDLTLPTQEIRTLPARRWLASPPDLNKRYCVFLLYK